MHAILAVSASHIRKLYENSNMPSGIDCHTLESHHLHLALSRIRVMFSEIDVVDNQDAFRKLLHMHILTLFYKY